MPNKDDGQCQPQNLLYIVARGPPSTMVTGLAQPLDRLGAAPATTSLRPQNNALSRLAGLVAVSLLALLPARGFVASLSAQVPDSGLPVEVRAQFLNNRARLRDIPIPAGLPPGQRAQAGGWLSCCCCLSPAPP